MMLFVSMRRPAKSDILFEGVDGKVNFQTLMLCVQWNIRDIKYPS